MLSSCGSHALTALHLCVTSDLILSHQLPRCHLSKELVICPGHLNNKFRWAEMGHIRAWWSIRHHGQVCQQQRTTVSVCSGLGLQHLDGILNSFYYCLILYPPKPVVYLIQNGFIQRCLPTECPNLEAQERRSLLFFFFWLFSAVLYSK